MRNVGGVTSSGARHGLALLAVVAAVLGATAIASTPFHDHQQACAAPIVSAVHGRSVRLNPGGPAAFLPAEVGDQIFAEAVTRCRAPARVRLGFAVGVMAVLLALAVRWSVLDPRRRYPVYAVGASLR